MPRLVCCLLLIFATAFADAQEPPRSNFRRSAASPPTTPQQQAYLEALRGRTPRLAETQSSSRAVAGEPVSLGVLIVALEGDVEFREGTPYDLDEFQSLLREWKQAGYVTHSEQYQLSTLENLQASVQVGHSIAVPTGQSTGFSRGRDGQPVRQTQYQQRETGTIVSATARIDPDSSVIVQIQVEQSLLETPEPKEGEDELVLPQINTLQTSTTAQVPNGKLIRIGGSQSTKDGKTVTQLILLHVQHHTRQTQIREEAPDEVEATDSAEAAAETTKTVEQKAE